MTLESFHITLERNTRKPLISNLFSDKCQLYSEIEGHYCTENFLFNTSLTLGNNSFYFPHFSLLMIP